MLIGVGLVDPGRAGPSEKTPLGIPKTDYLIGFTIYEKVNKDALG
jgi:hypothetical protein